MIKIKIDRKSRDKRPKDLPNDISEKQIQAYKQYKEYNKNTVENASNYLKIWDRSPSFKDVNSTLTAVKVGVVGTLDGIIIMITYLLFQNLIVSLVAGITCLVLFVFTFYDQFFSFKDIFSMGIKSTSRIYPFKDLQFWMINSTPDVILYTNIKDNMTMGVKIFQIKSVAENVDPNYLSFLKGLANYDIPFTYQVIQQPLIGTLSRDHYLHYKLDKSFDSLRTILYICTFYDVKGTNKKKIGRLLETLNIFVASLNNAFKANYRHYKIKTLEGKKLIEGIQTMFNQVKSPQTSKKIPLTSFQWLGLILKSCFLTMISVYGLIILNLIGVHYLIMLAYFILLNASFFPIFWREILFTFSRSSAFYEDGITFINPFEKVRFYYYKHAPESIFTVVDNHLLIGTKIFNHSHIIPPFLDSRIKPIAKIEKFMEALIPSKIPVTLTTQVSPIQFSTLENLAWDYLLDRTQYQVLRLNDSIQRKKFLQYRYGIFRTILTMGIHELRPIKKFSLNYVAKVEDALNEKRIKIMSAFSMKMDNHKGRMLRGKYLLSGYLFECLKNKFFRLNGSHLSYLLIHGAYLQYLIEVYPEFKKGIDTKIAAEFNAPLPQENYIVIGHSINTEFYEKEVRTGFRKDQLGDILITGGSNEMREMAMMKMAIELIQERIPCIIFDYTGNWSKILTYFKQTRYDDNLEYFTLGSSFTLNLLSSGLSYDQDNIKYLNLMFTALGLAFQKEDHAMDTFRAKLLSVDSNMDNLSSLTFMNQKEQDKPEWKKDTKLESILNLFEEFIHQNMDVFPVQPDYDDDDAIGIKEFIVDDENVIIDLSKISNLRKKAFATLLILAKIIHYSESDKPYKPKILLVPNLDVAFPARFLEGTSNYGKIDEFMEPLKRAGFGMIASNSSIHALHSHAFIFFRNYIAFKITDRQDTQIIDKLMNFRSLHNKGMFGKERKEAFQHEYLRTQGSREALIKRSDIEQPFPLKFDVKKLMNTPRMKKEEIITFMLEHGHDMVRAEHKIIEKSKKTLFKKDFDEYYSFIDEIIAFMEAIKTIQDVSGNYKNVLKEELLRFIAPRAERILGTSKKKKKVVQFRNDVFKILLKHGYLIENHPLHASGSESIRTSYRIGAQYEKALEEYNKKKEREAEQYFLDTIGTESEDLDPDNDDGSLNIDSDENKMTRFDILKALVSELTGLFDIIFQIHRTIKRGNFAGAQRLEKKIINSYFERAYCRVHDKSSNPSKEELSAFINQVVTIEEFPLSREYLETLIHQCQSIELTESNIEKTVKDLYEKLEEFFHELSNKLVNKER